MLDKAKAPAEVLQDQGRGRIETIQCTDDSTARKSKRKLKSVWYEGRGRFLYRYGANGSPVFDTERMAVDGFRRRVSL